MTPVIRKAVMARQMDEKRRMEEPRDNYRYYDRDGTRMDYSGVRMDYDDVRHDHDVVRGNYPDMTYGDTEARFRDRRGREHYDNGRFAPKSMEEYENEPESRRYRRDDAGRSEYPYTPLVPPVYRGDAMNRIGFAAEPRREMDHDYRTDANYPRMNEMTHRTSDTTMGHAKGGEMMFTEEMADEWMKGLHNEDGTKGPHWTKEQVKQVMNQKGIKVDPIHFWAAMNASYSDLCAIAKKHGINTVDFYTDYSVAFWLQDKDAVEDKLCAYFLNVVK